MIICNNYLSKDVLKSVSDLLDGYRCPEFHADGPQS